MAETMNSFPEGRPGDAGGPVLGKWAETRQFLVVFLPVAALLTAALLTFHFVDIEFEKTALQNRETRHVELGRNSLASDLGALATDVLILAQSGEFAEADREKLKRQFLVFAKEKRVHDQVRFLDAAGMEVVRVNVNGGAPAIVPDEDLQDKSKRYYFRETIALANGEVYVSPLDLNIERGRIEEPLKPVLLVGTPVFCEGGHKIGVVVLNYMGAAMLERFAASMALGEGENLLVNSGGYWLLGPKAEDEWGFMLSHERSFAKTYPDAWRRMGQAESGQFFGQDGLFTFATFYPDREIQGAAAAGRAGSGRFWKIVTRLGPEIPGVAGHSRHRYALAFYAALVLLSAFGSWRLEQARAMRWRAETAVKEGENHFRAFLDDSPADASIKDMERRYLLISRQYRDWFDFTERLSKGLTARYILVLAVLAGLALGSYLLLEQAVADNESGAALVNVGGRQRMLSQRVALLAEHLAEDIRPANLQADREALRKSIELMERSLGALVKGDPGMNIPAAMSEEARALYFGPKGFAGRLTRAFLDHAKAFAAAADRDQRPGNPHLHYLLEAAPGELLDSLDAVVSQYQKESERRVADLRAMQGYVLALTLVVLALSAFAVFRPMVRRVRLDIGERIKAEARLNEAIESISDGFAIYDAEDRLVLWNSRYARRFHARTGDVLFAGSRLEDIVRAAAETGLIAGARGRVEDWVGERLDWHRDPQGPFEIEATDGGWRMHNEYRTSDGGTVLISADISELKRREAALIEAKTEADAANRAKSEFLANMSHELRTPLNSIIGFSEVMGGQVFGNLGNAKYAEYVKVINGSGKHLLKIIDDILDVSRIEAGKVKLEKKKIDVAGTGRSCAAMVAERARNAGLSLSMDVEEGVPELDADPTRVKQILLNLLANAIKFTPEGGRITVVAGTGEDGAPVIEIADSGIGIAAQDLPRVLQPFAQVENAMTRAHEGLGLGLPLAKSLMELHGGTLTIDSEAGRGTTVTLRFPEIR
jgi:signal transduction histidine kinase